MGYFAASGGERDIDGPGPSADAGVITESERELHQDKNGVNEYLRGVRRKTRLSISTVVITGSE